MEYDEDFEDEEEEPEPRRPRKLAKDISEEEKAEYVQLLLDGYDVQTAARMLGTTSFQFKKFRNGGYWHDPAFADQVAAALDDPRRKANQRERLDGMIWSRAEEGEWRAIEKLLYAYHPDFEHLRHTNLRVSGEIMVAAKQLLPHLSDDEIRARIEAIEAQEKPRLLEPPKEEAA